MRDDSLIVDGCLMRPASWAGRRINVALIGAGGTGAEVFEGLVRLDMALRARGGHGFSMSVFDPGVVREPNIIRQRFWPGEIGQNKAVALTNRTNLLLGTDYDGVPTAFSLDAYGDRCDLVITCVDTASARVAIGAELSGSDWRAGNALWLDFGNDRAHGQVVFGKACDGDGETTNVLSLYPEVRTMKDSRTPSCSMAEAIASQDVFVNQAVALAGLNTLRELLFSGKTNKNVVVVSLPDSFMGASEFRPAA